MSDFCKDIAPVITFLFVIEVFIFQILFLLLRFLIFGNRNLCCLGFPSTFLAIFVVVYFKLNLKCEDLQTI